MSNELSIGERTLQVADSRRSWCRISTNSGDMVDGAPIAGEGQSPERLKHFLDQRSKAYVGQRDYYVNSVRGIDCTQHARFSIHDVCNTNVLVYIIVSTKSSWTTHELECYVNRGHKQARATIEQAIYAADPLLLLDQRSYVHECTWSVNRFPQRDLENHLDEIIRDHLVLCDWLEEKCERLKHKNKGSVQLNLASLDRHESGLPLGDSDMIMPMMRSILIFFRPASSENAEDAAGLILTGNHAKMQSGPISLKSLVEYRLPDHPFSERMVYVPLAKAVDFLTEIDRLECAANQLLRDRNDACARKTREQLSKATYERP